MKLVLLIQKKTTNNDNIFLTFSLLFKKLIIPNKTESRQT